MTEFNTLDHPHRRYNPLTGEWVLVSPHRSKRPWQGQDELDEEWEQSTYKSDCFLCPGNERISGDQNPVYVDTFVFNNDYAALTNDTPESVNDGGSLMHYESARGVSRVICFSPDHSKTLPELKFSQIKKVVNAWENQIDELSNEYVWVQVFENKGSIMGCSQPHPHSQVWANNFIPNEVKKKDDHLRAHYEKYENNLLLEYVEQERADGDRTVVETEYWLAVVPYWASWPFETLLLPKSPANRFDQLNKLQKDDLAIALKKLTSRYDNLFKTSFPYSMGWHFAPFVRDQQNKLISAEHWQLHASFYPPLLRSATVRKFMVGYEMLAEPQRDLTPEQAASLLRRVSDVHYRTSSGDDL